jgi:hypothetical protein
MIEGAGAVRHSIERAGGARSVVVMPVYFAAFSVNQPVTRLGIGVADEWHLEWSNQDFGLSKQSAPPKNRQSAALGEIF